MRAVHPVFHVYMLEPSIPNTIPDRVQTPPPPVMVDGELEYEISEILNSKLDNRRCLCKLLYLVKWSGYEGVKLGIWTEMSGPKSCEALASTCGLRRSLDGCLEFWRSGRSRRVQSRAEKKLKKDKSELRRSRLLS